MDGTFFIEDDGSIIEQCANFATAKVVALRLASSLARPVIITGTGVRFRILVKPGGGSR